MEKFDAGLIAIINLIIEKLILNNNSNFVTDDLIMEAVDQITKVPLYSNIDKYQLVDFISNQHSSYFHDMPKMLRGNQKHKEWLNPDTGKGYHRDITWKFWDDYRNHLVGNAGFSYNIVNGQNGIGPTVDKILAVLDDPTEKGPWDRRGLVVGEVQSGKTANYTGLVCKAADAGYNVIIILAGMYNDLRAQTQQRLDESFIGYDTALDLKLADAVHKIGVGKIMGHPPVHYYTHGASDGDFSKKVSMHTPAPLNYNEPIIIIVKKHKSIMEAIEYWLNKSLGKNQKQIHDATLLLIDDECDNASVNTRKFNDEDDDYDPTAINYGIRNILQKFRRSAYIGYTATPFANILMKRNDKHKKLGEDLFPKDFILNIPKPVDHTGPEEFFGRDGDDELGIPAIAGYPLVEFIRDGDILLPEVKQLKTQVVIPETLNPSLIKAIYCFILSSAARLSRNQTDYHNSMLIHVTHYVNAHTQIKSHIENTVITIRGRINNAGYDNRIWKFLENYWVNEFLPVSMKMESMGQGETQNWDMIRPHIQEAVERLSVIEVNGNDKDGLQYKNYKDQQIYKNFIAVGGNRLSRGLTLEGLTVSYYLRASTMYDTLMQMGRWFGYRPGYLDLCRIFTTSDLMSSYRHITLATKELRDDFDKMYDVGERPENWGLRIRAHPYNLMVTGYGKRHWGTKASVSFSGELLQTHNTFKDKSNCEYNYHVIKSSFLDKYTFSNNHNDIAFIAKQIKSTDVEHFIREFRVGPSNHWRSEFVAQFINKMTRKSWLTDWTVAIMNANDKAELFKKFNLPEQPSIEIQNIGRIMLTLRNGELSGKYISMDRAVMSPSHEKLDFPYDEIIELRGVYGKAIRAKRPPQRGFIMLYPLYGSQKSEGNVKSIITSEKKTYGLDGFPVFGAVISFPGLIVDKSGKSYVYDEKSIQIEIPY